MSYSYHDTLIFVEDISVQYDETLIIKDVNFVEKDVVREGYGSTAQFIAIIGRSGRGKSTLLKALTGLVKPTTGKVFIKDFTRTEADAAKMVKEGDIGFVDQKYTLFRHKTVYQALFFALRKTQLSKEAKEDKISAYLDTWGLSAAKDKYPNELSGGQRQRTAIIEQLLSSDQFIVMDEPFSGLDVGNILEVKKSFDLLNSISEFHTVIFTTHDIELAIELAQVIYIIGYPTVAGALQNYGTIVARHDLRDMDLAWNPYSEKHAELYKKIVDEMMAS